MDGSYDGAFPSAGGVGHVGSSALAASVALPEHHEDQLALGMRMVQSSFNNKMQALENELLILKQGSDDYKTQAGALQRKNAQLEQELVESHQNCQKFAEDNKELYKQVQQLRRQLSGLDALKQKVLHSISTHREEGELPPDITQDSARSRAISDRPLPSPTFPSMSMSPGAAPAELSSQRLPPPAEPIAAPVALPPVRRAQDGGAEAPPAAGGVDGKAFFRQARQSLTYESFNEFLGNIKRLNTAQQTREETLEQAKRIFGKEHEHLYKEFTELLNNVVAM